MILFLYHKRGLHVLIAFQGQPYKYVAQHKTEFNWNEAPAVAYHAKKFLQERVSLVHPDALEFNEILSVGYFEGGRMGVSTLAVFSWHAS